ncbi:putative transcriptional regulator [Pseudomonas phage OBP]|uniref:putative transcriptional regulator n=1 Tax=Pseudomonas phage OBP TaxID=1124849 RepID=UPI000240D587|nr:putative transcriptional regulator [Pseudomonas phage OBP]AEV89604.1 putative transcriptional regulator [Pseudomonas phage OBP]
MPPKNVTDVPETIKRAIYAPIYEEMSQLKRATTQKELASTFGVSQTTIGSILNGGIQHVSLNKLIPIATQMGIEMSITTSASGVDKVTKITR